MKKEQAQTKTTRAQSAHKNVIPVFFAADDNYVPFLAVTLQSIKAHISPENEYKIYVLHAGVERSSVEKIKVFESEGFSVDFVDVTDRLAVLSGELQLRDYYSCATYYRIFIAGMFPEYQKAIYLDCDIVVRCDLAVFYAVDLADNYVAAVPDGAVGAVPEFRTYTKETLGIDAENYFNAGVLLLNLDVLRKEDFYGKFSTILKQYKFSVAQDQDYLNAICRGRVRFLDDEWNAMPIGSESQKLQDPKIIHYNLTMKPWHYDNLIYREYFWENADKTEYADFLRGELAAYGEKEKQRDSECEVALRALALKESEREDNYFKRYVKGAK